MPTDGQSTLRPQIAATAALLVLGLALNAGLAGDGRSFDPRVGSFRGLAHAASDTLSNDGLNRIDTERVERGYYEALLDVGRRLDEPATGAPDSTPDDEGAFRLGGLALPVDDVREFVLRPDLEISHPGGRWTTNPQGMRDRQYAPTRPPDTVRLAVTGDSIAAGWRVDDDETFEAILERSLDTQSRRQGGPAVEILNHAVPGLAPGQRWETFTRADGWSRGIDLVIYEATPADLGWDERRLRALLPHGIGPEAAVYRDSLAAIGIHGGGTRDSYRRLLRPHRWSLLEGVYRRIAADCAERGVPCLWVLIPRVGKSNDAAERAALIDLARQTGFAAVIDLSDTFEGADPATLAVAPDDYHPNADGHARIARRLEAALRSRPEWVEMIRAGSPRVAHPADPENHEPARPPGTLADAPRQEDRTR